MKWKEKNLGIPKHYVGKVPGYQVIKKFTLNLGKEELEVCRYFSECQEGLSIYYRNKEIKEEVHISESKIVKALLSEKQPDLSLFLGKTTFKEFDNGIDQYIKEFHAQQSKPKILTYHNIKRLEDLFRSLPYQEDFQAIYNGSGIFN